MAEQLGYSPDQLEDWSKRYGGPDNLMREVLAARYKEASAKPELLALTPEDRAQLDRYANFAVMKNQTTNPVTSAANLVGGLGAMAVTEAAKAAPSVQQAMSSTWNRVTGQPESKTQFFGGADTSKPSLANVIAALYGYTR